MPRPKQPELTENEIEVMKILWEKSPLKVSQILEEIKRKPRPAYTSLMTLVQIMTQKGYLEAIKEGKAFLYSPLLKQKKIISEEIKRISKHFFNGSKAELILNLVEDKQLSKSDISKLKELLENDQQC